MPRQLELAFDPIACAIERLEVPRLIKALLLSMHRRGGCIPNLNQYRAMFHSRDVAAADRAICGAIGRRLVVRTGRGITLNLEELMDTAQAKCKASLREHRHRERAWCQIRRQGLRAEEKKPRMRREKIR